MGNDQTEKVKLIDSSLIHNYGGSVEHWFNSTTGVEAGVIWMRDMFSGKMRPQPKLELLLRPGR